LTWHFAAGVAGFFSLMFIIVKAEEWGYSINRKRGPQIGWVIVLAWGTSCAILMAYGGHTGAGSGLDCYTDWDGRTNPIVCD
jgi:hypothetical protein